MYRKVAKRFEIGLHVGMLELYTSAEESGELQAWRTIRSQTGSADNAIPAVMRLSTDYGDED